MAANGAEQLRLLAARAKVLGERGLLNATRAEIRAGAQPLIAAMRSAATEKLPHAGGLNEQVAGQQWTVSVLTGARTAGVRLRTNAPDAAMTDDGFVRHPVFGDRDRWVTQQIPGARGWASDTFREKAPPVAAAALATLGRAVAASMVP